MLAKIIGDELGNREGWSISTKLTTLLYYLIHSLLPFLLPILLPNSKLLLPNSFWRGRKKILFSPRQNELGNRSFQLGNRIGNRKGNRE